MKLGNPKKRSREMLNFAGAIIFGQLLFIIIERGGETALGIFMHLTSANLEFDNALILSNDSSMKRLIAILFWYGNIILDAAGHGGIEGMDDAKSEITICNIGDDDAESGEVVDFAHVLIMLGELFMKGIDGFDAAVDSEFNFFATESLGNLFFNFL